MHLLAHAPKEGRKRERRGEKESGVIEDPLIAVRDARDKRADNHEDGACLFHVVICVQSIVRGKRSLASETSESPSHEVSITFCCSYKLWLLYRWILPAVSKS